MKTEKEIEENVEQNDSKETSGKKKSLLKTLWLPALLLVAILGSFVLFNTVLKSEDVNIVPLSQVVDNVNSKNVTEATLNPTSSSIEVTLKDGSSQTAYYPTAYADTLTTTLISNGVPTTSEQPSSGNNFFSNLLLSMLPMLLIIGALFYFMKSGLGGFSAFKNGRGDKLGEIPATRFKDVAGCDEAVEELSELVAFLSHDEDYAKLGAIPPRGALLVGPPGTGKTLLARAVAGEAGVPYYPIAGSDFVEVFAGAGARRVRDLFDTAKNDGKAIIFIDELDAVGRARSDSLGAADSERDNTLIALLNEIDGFTESKVIVIAATNRPELLDPALTRPGRIEREVHVPLPDRGGRERILKVHTENKPLADNVNLTHYAKRTPGFSGAELAQLANEAAIVAGRHKDDEITSLHFDEALATLALGRARTSALVTERDREITAHHEAAHALVALKLPDADDPVAVSITPRGAAGGVTWMGGNDDLFMTRTAAKARLAGLLAGQQAERLLLDGDFTTGASSDLSVATNLARAMVVHYGMGEKFAVVDAALLTAGGSVSDETERAVEELLVEAAATAKQVLIDNKPALEALAQTLLEEETLDGDGIKNVVKEAE